jgi:UDP-GlcNAc:undecaprenyl-phosphate GlcNAc-1-phosphate transferase
MMACFPLFHKPVLNDDVVWLQLVILGFPVADTLLAPLRRFIAGAHPFKADKEHIHHRLMSVFRLTHKNAVLRIYGISLLLAASAVSAAWLTQTFGESSGLYVSIIFAMLFAIALTGLRRLGYMTSFVGEPIKRPLNRHILKVRAALKDQEPANPLTFERESV